MSKARLQACRNCDKLVVVVLLKTWHDGDRFGRCMMSHYDKEAKDKSATWYSYAQIMRNVPPTRAIAEKCHDYAPVEQIEEAR